MSRDALHRVARRGLPALISALVLLGTVAGTASAQAVFINEIHYDNVGVDQDEGVELAGPAGTNLSAYSVELYNGYDGRRYATIPLSGTLPDEENGYGARFFAIPGLQNGAPDGIALIGPLGVEQAFGYEGTFTAVDGDAAGMSLADIGQFEPPSTPVGRSLQLQGTGTTSSDFEIRGPVVATPGEINTRQYFRGPPPGQGTPGTAGLPSGCVATRYSAFFIRAAAVRINGGLAYFHATNGGGHAITLRTIAGRDAVQSVSYRLDGRMLSHARRATLDTAALSRTGTHRLTITIAGHGRAATITRTFRFRRYSTLCQVRRVVGTIRRAHARVQGAGVTVQALVPPTIKGGAKLRFVVSATHANRLRSARFFLNGRELRGEHAMNAGLTAPQLQRDGWQTLSVRITPRHGHAVTLRLRFKTRVMTLEPMAGGA
jgi:hypothetical protein